MSAGVPRIIVGNLDCESEFAAVALGRRADAITLPSRVRSTISAAATLLRVFARDGDVLWTPAAVSQDQVASVDGLPTPTLRSGPLAAMETGNKLIAWGETLHANALRPPAQEPVAREASRNETSVHEVAWSLPVPSPSAALKANDRRFALEMAMSLGCALSGSRTISSLRELEAHVRADGAALSSTQQWVVKAPFSAAGRWRVIGRGKWPPPERDLQAVENLLERFGELVFEPWVDRLDDFAETFVIEKNRSMPVSSHRQTIDRFGRFRGIELHWSTRRPHWFAPPELERVLETVDGATQRLRDIGYCGPVTVDLFRFRTPDGTIKLHPLGEINARLSFGFVARALVGRLAPAFPDLDRDLGLAALRFGNKPGWRDPTHTIPLVHPTETCPIEIALDITSRPTGKISV